MPIRETDGCCVPNEVFDRLYKIRKSLIWKSFRLLDEDYVNVLEREGMAMDLDNLAEEVEYILALLGVDLAGHFDELHLPEEAENTPLGRRWKDFWVARAKKTSG